MDGEGQRYTATINEHGAKLSSDGGTLFLGRSCDALSSRHGKGHWGWANGGLLVTFDDRTIGFPRQEIEFDNAHDCRL